MILPLPLNYFLLYCTIYTVLYMLLYYILQKYPKMILYTRLPLDTTCFIQFCILYCQLRLLLLLHSLEILFWNIQCQKSKDSALWFYILDWKKLNSLAHTDINSWINIFSGRPTVLHKCSPINRLRKQLLHNETVSYSCSSWFANVQWFALRCTP